MLALPYAVKVYRPADHNNRAVEALDARRYDQAIGLLDKAMAGSPGNTTFRQNLLLAYNAKAVEMDQAGQVEEAAGFYEKALALGPVEKPVLRNFVSSLNNRAVAKSTERDFPGSQKLFEAALEHLPALEDTSVTVEVQRNYSSLLTLWGGELMKRNQIAEARKAFEDSLGLRPDNAVANIYLGDLRYESNDYVPARGHYAAALAADTQNKDYLVNRLQMIDDEAKVEDKFRQTSDPDNHFVIQYVPYATGIPIDEVARLLGEAYKGVGRDLGLFPPRPVNVKVYESADFYRISKLPEWAIGLFDGKIRLKVEDLRSAPSQVRDLLFHEYTHAVLAMNVKQRVPAWFHEGLAQLMEPQFNESRREQAQMRDALATGKLDFAGLSESFRELSSKDDAESAYLLSKYFLIYLKRRHGPQKLVDWVRRMAAEEKFEDAFATVYGTPLSEAQSAWIKTQARD